MTPALAPVALALVTPQPAASPSSGRCSMPAFAPGVLARVTFLPAAQRFARQQAGAA